MISLLESFVAEIGQAISSWLIENESGATLKWPELFRLLDVAQRGDILLVEQVDCSRRLNLCERGTHQALLGRLQLASAQVARRPSEYADKAL